ncbi:uncharacterized protein LOC112480270 [Pteropus alecto]|uniref:uncharacterized protein LOC112480270 n=1 Tax=Pteropus alecto TaxID=9402 RepID=UPI000D532A6E|nr:uncharacterized protein LOC112480270 [Pteropus alecto]
MEWGGCQHGKLSSEETKQGTRVTRSKCGHAVGGVAIKSLARGSPPPEGPDCPWYRGTRPALRPSSAMEIAAGGSSRWPPLALQLQLAALLGTLAPQGPEPGVASAGVWLGHPDARLPAGSSASPCLLKEGLELAQTLRPESLLLVSTLDGSLHALSKQTGDLKWTLKDDPAIQGPTYVTETAFLSDPADGSLYILGTQKQQGLMVRFRGAWGGRGPGLL